jgi:hypothetical protein
MPEMRLRRHAIEIVGQLPENPTEALRVLQLAKDVVERFLCSQDASGGRIPNLRAISNDSPAGSPSRTQPVVNP